MGRKYTFMDPPAFGRFNAICNLADSFSSHTPYHFGYNSPVMYNSPISMAPERPGPGSGNHWSDEFRTVGDSLTLMSTTAFRFFYGLNDGNGETGCQRVSQLAQGLGVTYAWHDPESTGSVENGVPTVRADRSYLVAQDGGIQGMDSGTSNAFIFGTGFAGVKKAGQLSVQEINRQIAINKLLNPSNGSPIKVPAGVKFVGKYVGFGFSAWSVVDVEQQYSNGELTGFQRGTEQISNGIGAIPWIGTGWSIGWEIGRTISNIPTYQEWKQDTWLPWRKEVFGY